MNQKIIPHAFCFQHRCQAFAEVIGRNSSKETGVHTQPVQIKLSDLLINVNTTTTDKFGLKAAGRTRYQQRCLRVTRAIRERKKTYGESVRLGANANVSYFFIGLKYPSKALRALMESLRRG